MRLLEMTAMAPVRFRHPLQLREPAAGFASRLAALNGRTMSAFLRDMLIPPRSIDKGVEASVRKLALKGAADPDILVRYSPKAMDGDERFHLVAGEVLGHLDVNRTYFRFCPYCVLGDLQDFDGPLLARPWLRLEWTIAHLRSCGKHGVFLTATQPVRRRFEPFDFAETMSRYVDNLSTLVEQSQLAPGSPYEAWLINRLDGIKDPNCWLDALPLYVAADWCEALGISLLHPPKVRSTVLSVHQWAAAADAGFGAASRGPDAIRTVLTELNKAQDGTRGFWGPRDTYGYAYGLLQRTLDDPEYEPIRDLVRSFALATIPIEPGTNVLGVTVEKHEVHTVRTAARASGAHDRTIRRLFERKGLGEEALAEGRRNHRVVVDANELGDILDKLKTAVTVPTVQKEWGIPLLHLRAMIAGGHLKTVTGSETQAYAKHRISMDDLQVTKAKFFAGAHQIENPLANQHPIAEARHRAGTSTEQVLAWIFDGTLNWKGRLAERDDYGALLLDVDELVALVRIEPEVQGFTKEAILSHIAGLGATSPPLLIAAGHLETEQEFSPSARRFIDVITRESAEAFRTRFVTLGELTQKTNLHHKQVRSILASAGIVEKMDAKSFKTFFYDRNEVDEAANANLGFWRYEKKTI